MQKIAEVQAVYASLSGRRLAGVDEVGRGPLAGPVVAAAVILDPHKPIQGLADSKKLSLRRREWLGAKINEQAVAVSIGLASVAEIDAMNILQASLLAMQRAVAALECPPEYALVDGNQCPRLTCDVKAIVRGDSLIPEISAASIVAKLYRDQMMLALDTDYPGYGLAENKGYPTVSHITALKQLGVSAIHRRSFKPVRDCLIENV